MLTLIGGLLGILLAWIGTAALVQAVPETLDITSLGPVNFNGAVLSFAALLIMGTALICGFLPALTASKRDPQTALRGGNAAHSRTTHLRRAFVIVQTALALTLLIGAGLLIRRVLNLNAAPIGFDPNNALTFDLSLPDASYRTDADKRAFFRRALEALQAIPE